MKGKVAVFEVWQGHAAVVGSRERVRSWMGELAGIEAPTAFTVQLDEPQIPKALRRDIAELLDQYYPQRPDAFMRYLKRWSAQNKPRRVPGVLTREAADQLAAELPIMGGATRVLAVPASAGASANPSCQQALSLPPLCHRLTTHTEHD